MKSEVAKKKAFIGSKSQEGELYLSSGLQIFQKKFFMRTLSTLRSKLTSYVTRTDASPRKWHLLSSNSDRRTNQVWSIDLLVS
jgi:hypothetical protein